MNFTTTQIPHMLLVLISIALPARCDTVSNQTLIFPHGSNSSNPDVSGLRIHNNDSIVVEYTKLPYTTAVGIDVLCYQSVLDAIVNKTWSDDPFYLRRSYLHCK